MSDGIGCTCHAYSEAECSCGVDWTPQIVYDQKAEIENLRDLLGKANALARIRADRIKEIEERLFNAEQQVIRVEKERDRFRSEADNKAACWGSAERQLAECRRSYECALSIAETHSDQWNEVCLALAASQAREAKLRDFIFDYVDLEPNNEAMIVRYDTCVKPTDDTALKEYRKKVLLEVAGRIDAPDDEDIPCAGVRRYLRRMAEGEK